MTIQLLHPYNGNRPGIYSSMGSTEEARLVGLGLARYWTDGIDGKNTQFSEAEKAAGQALVSGARNLAALTAPGLLSGVTYDSSNRAVQWTIDGVTYSANYSIAAINVAGSDGTITNISVDPAQRITAVATA